MKTIKLIIRDGILNDVFIPLLDNNIVVAAYQYGEGFDSHKDENGNPCYIDTWMPNTNNPQKRVSDLLCECITSLIDLSNGYPQNELTRSIAEIVNDSKEALKAIGVDTEELGDVEVE